MHAGTQIMQFFHLRQIILVMGLTSIAFGLIGVMQICRTTRVMITPHEIRWLKPWGSCIFMGLIGSCFLLFPFQILLDARSEQTLQDILASALFGMLSFGAGLVILRFAATQQFRFDLDRGTYLCRQCLLFYTWDRSGSIRDDVAGVYIALTNSNWAVRISWKNRNGSLKSRLMAPALILESQKNTAEVRAQELAAALGVPVVPNPRKQW